MYAGTLPLHISKTVGTGSPVVIETFTSDDDGNLLTRTDTATSVVTSYTWDDFNRLTAVSATDASKNQTHTFGINGFRRKKKDKNDVETTEYAAGLETAVAKNSTETITYLTGGGGIMGFERTSDGAMFYFITDALSTVRDVVDNSGTVVASYEFSEYGQKISPANTGGVESQKTFVGGMSVQDEVAATGLMLMGHRFYDPGLLGRFLNRDPIGYQGGLNLFEYAGSNPATFVDPNGLQMAEYYVDEYVPVRQTIEIPEWQKKMVAGFYAVIGAWVLSEAAAASLTIASLYPLETAVGVEVIGSGLAGYEGPGLTAPVGASGPGGLRNPCGGKLSKGASRGIKVSPKGYDIVESHVRSFGYHSPNEAMLGRLRAARDANQRVYGGDANFFLHEAAEATMYKKGMDWPEAHPASLEKYNVHDYAVYPQEVVEEFSEY